MPLYKSGVQSEVVTKMTSVHFRGWGSGTFAVLVNFGTPFGLPRRVISTLKYHYVLVN